jgi:NAD+ synthase
MGNKFRLTLAQLNPTVGALGSNAQKVRDAWAKARDAGADMIAFPEMFISGYQTQDLVMKPAFCEDCIRHIKALAVELADGPAIGIGGPYAYGDKLHNAYWILEGGEVRTIVLKHNLPNETVFDEVRLYSSGPINGPYKIGPLRIGTPICEDAWHPEVSEALAETGAEILLVPNGSPYYRGKFDRRLSHMVARVVETACLSQYGRRAG